MCQVDLSNVVRELELVVISEVQLSLIAEQERQLKRDFQTKKKGIKEAKKTVRCKLKSMLSERGRTQNFDDIEEF